MTIRRIVHAQANAPVNPILLSLEKMFSKSILVRLKTKSKRLRGETQLRYHDTSLMLKLTEMPSPRER